MKIELEKRPSNPIIIEGFPGFGLVSTIATEFLISHLGAVQIGRIIMEEVPPMVAVQKGRIIEPIGIFYAKKYNLIILNAITSVTGFEWEIAKQVVGLGKMLKAKEIVCIEGIGSATEENNMYYLTNKEKNVSKLEKKTGLGRLKDGIIMGVTGAMVLHKTILTNCFFVETHSNLPDSRAAAKIIEILDKYIGLKLDPKPLIAQAENFETKIKDLVEKSKSAGQMKQQKELSYLG
ncbi:MAG: PAC2 family protein [Candidatus Woesearchaeota archaeon]